MQVARTLELDHIDQVVLCCHDLDEAERFYCGLLGLTLGAEEPGNCRAFSCGGTDILMVHTRRVRKITRASRIYFSVPGRDPDAIHEKVKLLRAAGVRVEEGPRRIACDLNGCDIWQARFRDPFGNRLGLRSVIALE